MSQKEMEMLQSAYGQAFDVRSRKMLRRNLEKLRYESLEDRRLLSGAILLRPMISASLATSEDLVVQHYNRIQAVSGNDPQSEEDNPAILQSGCIVFIGIKGSLTEEGFVWRTIGPRKRQRPSSRSESSTGDSSPAALLSKIASKTAGHEERRRAVIEAEVVAFPPKQIETLNRSLRRFIEDNRNSDNPNDVVAVGSALRKYVMNMPEKELAAFHRLFDPSDTVAMPFEVELELVKTVLWKLTASPPESDDTLPELADRLMDRIETYLRPWILLRENHAAVAQDAALSLLLLRSRHVPRLLTLLQDLSMDWFTDLLVRRGRWLRHGLEARLSPQTASRCIPDFLAMEKALHR